MGNHREKNLQFWNRLQNWQSCEEILAVSVLKIGNQLDKSDRLEPVGKWEIICRLEITRNRRDRRLCKIVSSCVILSRKQRISMQDLRRDMKFSHIFDKFTQLFQKLLKLTYLCISFSTKKGLRSVMLTFTLFYR